MKHATSVGSVTLLALALLVSGLAPNGWAASRIFVASNGIDRSPGTAELPKRTFAQAIEAVDPGGEIVVLDSGAYGPIRIGKSLSIIAPAGVYAGVRGDIGVVVDAGGSNVVLRGLTIQADGAGSVGISVTAASLVHVENCVINAFSEGVVVSGPARLFLKDSTLRGNTFAAVRLRASRASLEHVRLEGGGHGLVTEGAGATVLDTVITGNGGTGILALEGSAVTVESSEITDSQGDGVSVSGAQAPSVLRLSNCTITDNIGTGVVGGEGGTVETRGNNTVRGNGTDLIGTLVGL